MKTIQNGKVKGLFSKAVSFILIATMMVTLAGCSSSLSGTYESESGKYFIKFSDSKECTWYEDGTFYNGTYEKTSEGYTLKMMGNLLVPNTVFEAVKDGNDLIITGGIVYGETFIKQ